MQLEDANEAPIEANGRRKSKDMTEELRKQVYQALLARSKNVKLGKCVTRVVAEQFGLHIRVVQRLWQRGKIPLAQSIPVNVASQNKGRVGRKTIPVDLEPLHNIPLKERMTIEDVITKLNIRKWKLQRYLKKGLLRRHSNSIKPHLTDANKKSRLQWCVDMIDQGSLHDEPKFKGFLTMCSSIKNGFSSLKNQRSTTCYPRKMIPVALVRARITFLGSCFCVFVLGQGLGMECVFFMGKLVVFHLLLMKMLKEKVGII